MTLDTLLDPRLTFAAQEASVRTYRDSERMLRRQARGLRRSDDIETADLALAIAGHVGLEMVRNLRGSDPDEWEKR